MQQIFRSFFIVRIVLRFGLDELVLSSFKNPFLQKLCKFLTFGRKLMRPRGVRLRLALENLGPVFVKFGQVLSTRPDLMPADISQELAKLQDNVPPFDSNLAKKIIEKSFNKSLEEIFINFNENPVASASIAQVHFGQIKDKNGNLRDVAIKILRPNMKKIIDKDVSLMYLMANLLEKLLVDAKRLKMLQVVAEFDTYLHDELDLIREASNASQLRRNMEKIKSLLIPEIFWDFCRKDVLCMEKMNGTPISQIEKLREAGVNIPKLAQDGVNLFFTQVFRDGFFHADMHPGNIMVSLDKKTFGKYILLDFGIVGALTEFDKEYLAQNFTAFFRRDYKRVATLHIESGWVGKNTKAEELEASIRSVCEPYFDRPLAEISLGMVLMRLFQTSRRFNVEIQPQLVLLQKTLLNIEGLGRQLDPNLDLWATAKPFLESWMKEQIGPKRFWNSFKNEFPFYAKLVPQIPRLVHDYLSSSKAEEKQVLQELLIEQKKTNNFLRQFSFIGLGFILGLIIMQIIFRLK